MIGVFDSGRGGISALDEIRRIAPTADLFYLADRKNAPYGTKSSQEILKIVKKNIERLASLGAEKILIACCTASTVWDRLSDSEREISYPIIAPTAKAAVEASGSGRIGVIATEATVRSAAFSSEIKRLCPAAKVFEEAAQEFVSFVESGASDGHCPDLARAKIHERLRCFSETDIDTLILGCTHFPHIEGIIGECLGKARLISCSKEGAHEIVKICNTRGSGETFYIE